MKEPEPSPLIKTQNSEENLHKQCLFDEDIDFEDLKAHLGYGQIGVLPLPTKWDEYEHSAMNFRG